LAISEDRNVIKKEAEKIIKYKDPAVEIKSRWNAKIKVKSEEKSQNHSENIRAT